MDYSRSKRKHSINSTNVFRNTKGLSKVKSKKSKFKSSAGIESANSAAAHRRWLCVYQNKNLKVNLRFSVYSVFPVLNPREARKKVKKSSAQTSQDCL